MTGGGRVHLASDADTTVSIGSPEGRPELLTLTVVMQGAGRHSLMQQEVLVPRQEVYVVTS